MLISSVSLLSDLFFFFKQTKLFVFICRLVICKQQYQPGIVDKHMLLCKYCTTQTLPCSKVLFFDVHHNRQAGLCVLIT